MHNLLGSFLRCKISIGFAVFRDAYLRLHLQAIMLSKLKEDIFGTIFIVMRCCTLLSLPLMDVYYRYFYQLMCTTIFILIEYR